MVPYSAVETRRCAFGPINPMDHCSDMTAPPPSISRLAFRDPANWLGNLRAKDVENILAAAADIVLLIDKDGVIRDISVGSEDLAREECKTWLDRMWIDTVTIESRPKIKDILSNAPGRARHRQVNHPSRTGLDLPVLYSAVRIGRGSLIALGRDLRNISMLQQRLVETQQAMEREYARIRLAETRYRMLFHLGTEPVFIVEAATQKVVEANPAAQKMMGGAGGVSSGTILPSLFDADSAESLAALLRSARIAGRAGDVPVTVAATAQRFRASASMFRQEQATFLLVRFAPEAVIRPEADGLPLQVLAMVDQLPDGFVIVDPDMKIQEANRAFLDFAELSTRAQAIGHDLGRWLGRPGIDLPLLSSALAEHGSVRAFPTIVQGAFGGVESVEVSAVAAPAGTAPTYGFVIRSTGARAAVDNARPNALPRSVGQLGELVGRVSLKEIVRETSDVIERLCIEAALDLSKDNRALAANMLGVSRQSLYDKLRRHGLGGLEDDANTNV